MRRLYINRSLSESKNSSSGCWPGELEDSDDVNANLISSLCNDGMHMPAIDIDMINVSVIPSSTDGNFHLYIDKKMTLEQYYKLLDVMSEVGIVEEAYVVHCRERGMSLLRRPGIKK